ncbi:hypothetical protein CIG75_16250 [Tumebacillus algifaecis]|uniref:Uncharacterized protein n=1 Tax=Tumebacillus algifaecis TaxID=1214604 RepID=A0A223D4H1_9BACL|nr:hypothetical protein [Tumebacillus algifaecis]ASS76347.1 hypothetical protein CIG75_16250 [Tumebacillus algifaecis]
MGIKYQDMPQEMLEQFRVDIRSLPYDEFLKWSATERQQVVALIIADFETFMTPDERMDLREAYLSTIKDADRQRAMYEHYRAALSRRVEPLH